MQTSYAIGQKYQTAKQEETREDKGLEMMKIKSKSSLYIRLLFCRCARSPSPFLERGRG